MIGTHLGLSLPNRGVLFGATRAGELVRLAEQAEASGAFGSVWVGDSLLAKPRLEAIALLAGIATRTTRVTLGTICMASMTLRDPILLAIQWASRSARRGPYPLRRLPGRRREVDGRGRARGGDLRRAVGGARPAVGGRDRAPAPPVDRERRDLPGRGVRAGGGHRRPQAAPVASTDLDRDQSQARHG